MQAEIGHGARYRTYIEWVTRGDQNHVERVALGFREHETIVVWRLDSKLQNGALQVIGFCKT
jgi:hypothetical protein